jgi:L-histidine Nalpha-methyltransferase
MLVLLLGSNLGNFDTPAAAAFLTRIRRALAPGDLLLLGADLVKSEPALLLAYDDPLGVTAAFNRNLLVRINRELGADFDLSAFAHRAIWNGGHQRIEMHLVSLADQVVRIPVAESVVRFRSGEWIWTESSYKYTPDQIVDMGAAASLATRDQWVDEDAGFALTMFSAV